MSESVSQQLCSDIIYAHFMRCATLLTKNNELVN